MQFVRFLRLVSVTLNSLTILVCGNAWRLRHLGKRTGRPSLFFSEPATQALHRDLVVVCRRLPERRTCTTYCRNCVTEIVKGDRGLSFMPPRCIDRGRVETRSWPLRCPGVWLRHGSQPPPPPPPSPRGTATAGALSARGPVYSDGAPIILGGVREAAAPGGSSGSLDDSAGVEKLGRVGRREGGRSGWGRADRAAPGYTSRSDRHRRGRLTGVYRRDRPWRNGNTHSVTGQQFDLSRLPAMALRLIAYPYAPACLILRPWSLFDG